MSKNTPIHDPSYPASALHADLEAGKFLGHYGGCNLPFIALAEAQSKTDLHAIQCKRSSDEYLLPELVSHLSKESTQSRWEEIVSIDPHGLTSTRPTIAATYAKMFIPELKTTVDGSIVCEDGGVKIIKCAVDYAWNLPGMSARLNVPESNIRASLKKYSRMDSLDDLDTKAYLPSSSGMTVYMFGDISKLSDPSTETAIRVHDECNGSDVFGTDICTCRPYLIFAIEGAIECAQRGGVGMVIYFRKEGRSLGEVTKYRVYNARKMQAGGDRPEMYFKQTEAVAGIRDARFQEFMPDVLLWLGIKRIDWLMSMSSEKYDAICAAGISVMQRISLPDDLVPQGASVEILAKICAGYHTDVSSATVEHNLQGLEMIRERCSKIYQLALDNKLKYFTMDISQLPKSVDLVLECIASDYPSYKDIPFHSRLRHFNTGGVDRITPLLESWTCDPLEKCRRLIDLVTVSVLLDAGAGRLWKYTDSEGVVHGRSEGLAIATLDMFIAGCFSSDDALPFRVNAMALTRLTMETLSRGFQISKTNPLVGLQGRHGILERLGTELKKFPEVFGAELARPGNIIDYVTKYANDENRVSIKVLWSAIMNGMHDVWPTTLSGTRRGDVWIYNPLKEIGVTGSDMIPFHKLSQWLVMSMMEPLMMSGLKFDDLDLITALAEYRNGGLFVDTGVLSLIDPIGYDLEHPVGSELIVEWRALTVVLVDMVADKVRERLGATPEDLPLPAILEGGTWKAGRVIAHRLRPETNVSPIQIRSDGTVF